MLIRAIRSAVNSDPEDLWDFGTVRHVGKPGTVGRVNNSIKVSGPPLTWEMNGSTPSEASSSLTTKKRMSNSSIRKTELPPLPTSPQSPRRTSYDHQATVRHMPSIGPANHRDSRPVIDEKRPAEEVNYDEDYVETYPRGASVVQKKAAVDDEDDLPGTTMLDSVILPALASVGQPLAKPVQKANLTSAIPSRFESRSSCCAQCTAACVYRGREDYTRFNGGTRARDR